MKTEDIMTTEQIIKTLREWKRIWKPTGELGITLDLAIEELQFAENKFRTIVARQNERLQELELTVARYERVYDIEANAKVEQEYLKEIRQLARERDEAREEAETVRALYKDATGVTGTLPWE